MWCRDHPLKEAFPDLYNISRSRDASVSEVMRCANGRISWDLQFRRLVNDQESHSLDSFLLGNAAKGSGFVGLLVLQFQAAS